MWATAHPVGGITIEGLAKLPLLIIARGTEGGHQRTQGRGTVESSLRNKEYFYYFTSVDNRVMSLQFLREAQFLGQDVQGHIRHKNAICLQKNV